MWSIQVLKNLEGQLIIGSQKGIKSTFTIGLPLTLAIIDELSGKDEYVIKSLGSSFENVKGIAGGAILADGKVGLTLDIYGIFEVVNG